MRRNHIIFLTLFVAMCSAVTSLGQIKKLLIPKSNLVGRIAPGGAITVSMQCYKYENDSYLFRYKDARYNKLDERKDFRINSSHDFETLYSYLKEGFENMPEVKVLLDIGNEFLILEFGKFLGGKVVRIYHPTSANDGSSSSRIY